MDVFHLSPSCNSCISLLIIFLFVLLLYQSVVTTLEQSQHWSKSMWVAGDGKGETGKLHGFSAAAERLVLLPATMGQKLPQLFHHPLVRPIPQTPSLYGGHIKQKCVCTKCAWRGSKTQQPSNNLCLGAAGGGLLVTVGWAGSWGWASTCSAPLNGHHPMGAELGLVTGSLNHRLGKRWSRSRVHARDRARDRAAEAT